MTQPLIALLTDFGTSDPYVGVMKGVIASRCPAARVIDITHAVGPQNVRQAAYLLYTAYRYFPAHTVFLVVVDPGVGTARRPVAVQTGHGLYVGPDNGVLSLVLDTVGSWQAVTLRLPDRLSATFHGRDLFAPMAADLACGSALSAVGSPTADLVHITLPLDSSTPGLLKGEVIHVDHFGNVVTSLGPLEWQPGGRDLRLMTQPGQPEVVFAADSAGVVFGSRRMTGIQATYAAARPGDLLALINSDQQLEIAANQGHAASLTGLRIGDEIQLLFKTRSI
jgi:S-adenosylmethionine hydrolase